MVIDEEPRGPGAKWHRALLGRRLLFAVLLAAAEAVLLLVWRPSLVWVILGGAIVLAACAGLLGRVGPGLGRDVLIILGGAQAILIAIPLVIGFGILVAVVVGMTALNGADWWQASRGAAVLQVALHGIKTVVPEDFGQYLP